MRGCLCYACSIQVCTHAFKCKKRALVYVHVCVHTYPATIMHVHVWMFMYVHIYMQCTYMHVYP